MGVDLADYFRGDRPWAQLYRFLKRFTMDSWYQSAVAMNPEIGWERAQKPRTEVELGPPTPQGYSLSVLLQLRIIDLLKEQMRAYAAGLGGKLPPPMKPEPRPMTAEDIFRDRIETANVYEALANLGVTN